MTLVHVNLSPELISNRAQLDQIAQAIVDATGMTKVNQKRLHRYAILSGYIPREQLPKLEQLEGVNSVQENQTRFATA